MSTSAIEVTVTIDEHREDMYAELFAGPVQWGEVRLAAAGTDAIVTVFPPLDGKAYQFTVVAMQRALHEAVSRLRKVERK